MRIETRLNNVKDSAIKVIIFLYGEFDGVHSLGELQVCLGNEELNLEEHQKAMILIRK